MGLFRRFSSAFQRTRKSVRSSFSRRDSRNRGKKDNELEKILNKAETALHFIEREGYRTLQQVATAESESLGETLATQRKFEKFYFLSMKYLDYGAEANEKLDEYIQQNGDDSGLNDKIEELDMQLYLFKNRIEERRQRIQESVYIVNELDKAYDWALQGVKMMSAIKEATNSDDPKCQEHNKLLEHFLSANPPFTEEHFTELCSKAKDMKHTEFLEQCELVRTRCQETHKEILEQISIFDKMREGESNRKEVLELSSKLDDEASLPGATTHEPHPETPKTERSVEGTTVLKDEEKDIPGKNGASAASKKLRDSLYSTFSVDSGISVNSRASRQNSPGDAGRCATDGPATDRTTTETNLEDMDDSTTLVGDDDNDRTLTESFIRREINKDRGLEDDTESSSNLSWIVNSSNSLDVDQSSKDLASETASPKSPPESNRHILDELPFSPVELTKSEKKMLLLVDEMIRTEKDYVSFLKYIIDHYVPEMDRENIPHGLRGLRSVVFGNLEKLYTFHVRNFLPSLEKYRTKPSKVGGCFLKYKKEFGLYSLYSKNKPKSDALLTEFRNFFNLKRVSLDDKLDLASYLLKPIQRLGKYALLLQDIVLACEDDDLDRVSLMDAIDLIHFQMRHGNDLLAMDHLKGVDFNIREQGELIRQQAFTVYRGHRKAIRHVFLFDQMLVFTKPVRSPRGVEEYRYKFSLKMNDIGLTENIGHSGLRFRVWFRKIGTGIAYTLHAPSVQLKQEWTTSISRILWSQAMKSKEDQTAELRSMGLESKPNLDLKPSADMIESRSVNVKLRRNRRPHSSFMSTSPTDKLMSGSLRSCSWLGSPPPTITEIDEEDENQDAVSLDGGRFTSELDITSLPDLTRSANGSSMDYTLDSMGTVAVFE